MRNDFFGEMAETGGVPLNASPVRRWAGVFGHRPFAFSISMGVKTSDGMNWNLQDLVYEALSEEWRKRDGEISDPWANDEADGYQPPSYEPVNPERRTAQTPLRWPDLTSEKRRRAPFLNLLKSFYILLGPPQPYSPNGFRTVLSTKGERTQYKRGANY